MPEEPQTKPKTSRDPQALTSEYHRARKQLMLWAGILFIWELVGIDLEKAKEAGGNAGAIITAIKSPQAVPWALLTLVAYFLFKTTIEWHQCNAGRRNLRASKIDFASAWITSLFAYGLYVWQQISQAQVADMFANKLTLPIAVSGFLCGVAFALGTGRLAAEFYFYRRVEVRDQVRLILAGPTFVFFCVVTNSIVSQFPWRASLISVLVGTCVGLLLILILVRVEGPPGQVGKPEI